MGTRFMLLVGCAFFLAFASSACVSKSDYEQVSSRLAQTQQEKSRLESDEGNLNSTISEFKSQVETSKAQLSDVKSTLSQEQARVKDLTSQVDTAKTDLSNVRSTLSQEQAKTKDLAAQLEAAKAANAKLQNPVTLSGKLPSVVSSFGQFTGWEGELQSLFELNGELYFSLTASPTATGIYRVKGEGSVELVNPIPITWMYIVWTNPAGQRYAYFSRGPGPNIYRFDGTNYTLVFTHSNPAFGASSFGVHDAEGRLYATGSSGLAAYTTDGATWTEDAVLPLVATPNHVYGLGALGNNIYAMSQVYGNEIIRKVGVGAWAFQKTYDAAGFYRRSPMWETPFGRQNWPLTDLIGERLWCGSHNGMAYVWDGTNLLRIFESYRPRLYTTDDGIPMTIVKPIVVEGILFLVVGAGSTTMSGGELWMWDGLQFYRLLQLPWRITSVELFQGHLWVGGNSYVGAGALYNGTLRDTQSSYTGRNAYLVSLPVDVLKNKELPPARRRIWDNVALAGGATLASTTDTGGAVGGLPGVMIPCTGYKRKTIYVLDSAVGSLTIQADMDGSGVYRDYPVQGQTIHTLDAGVGKRFTIEEGVAFLRLVVTQGPTAGNITAQVLLE